jgi:hypothetical protein
MISRFKDFEQLFLELNTKLDSKINIYIIGGAVLLYRNLKPSTKDIDLVVGTKKEFIHLQNTLVKLGFKTENPSHDYRKLNLSQIFIREDLRIDLFETKVCSQFQLSKEMIQRVELILKLEKLNVYLCSNEDIFMFKTITEREGDLQDCIALSKLGLNWKTILREIKNQIKINNKDVWITWIEERLNLLEDMGLQIPIIKEVRILSEKYYSKLEKN